MRGGLGRVRKQCSSDELTCTLSFHERSSSPVISVLAHIVACPASAPRRDTSDSTAVYTANYIIKRINAFRPTAERPFVLGLPTGGTPMGTYKELVKAHKEGKISFKDVHTVCCWRWSNNPWAVSLIR